MTAPFEGFAKIARLSRSCVITEKLDGTNAQIFIGEDGEFLTGSRSQWITPEKDNYGFSRWAHDHREELMALGTGRHFGEWWGSGIQRRYGLAEKRFSLFNVKRWAPQSIPSTHPDKCACDSCVSSAATGVLPACCSVVPVLYAGLFADAAVEAAVEILRREGSRAAPGFMQPEGVIVYHVASGQLFKKTLLKDERPKGSQEVA